MTYKTKPVHIKAWQHTGGSDQLETWRFQEWVKDELPDYVDKLSGARWVASTDAIPIFNIKYIPHVDEKKQYMPLMEFPLNVNEWFIFNPTLKECDHIPFNVHSEKYFKTFFEEV